MESRLKYTNTVVVTHTNSLLIKERQKKSTHGWIDRYISQVGLTEEFLESLVLRQIDVHNEEKKELLDAMDKSLALKKKLSDEVGVMYRTPLSHYADFIDDEYIPCQDPTTHEKFILTKESRLHIADEIKVAFTEVIDGICDVIWTHEVLIYLLEVVIRRSYQYPSFLEKKDELVKAIMNTYTSNHTEYFTDDSDYYDRLLVDIYRFVSYEYFGLNIFIKGMSEEDQILHTSYMSLFKDYIVSCYDQIIKQNESKIINGRFCVDDTGKISKKEAMELGQYYHPVFPMTILAIDKK